MRLSILIAAMRNRPWQKIYDSLRDQAKRYGDQVEVLIELDDGESTSGSKRQKLLNASRGEYVTCVDDDDAVDPDYVSCLLSASNSKADVLTFCLGFHVDGRRTETWKFGLYTNDRRRGLMCVNHLCAWRREIATRVAWCPKLGNADDHLWFQPLYHSGAVRTQFHTDKVLYNYLYSSLVTVNQRADRVAFRNRYIGNGIKCYIDELGEILLEERGHSVMPDNVLLRDRNNIVFERPVSGLRLFHTVRT